MKKDWEIKKLGDLVTQINGLWKGKKEPFINVAVIRNTNFSKDCKLKLDDVEYLDVELKQYSSRKLQAGDIIIEKSGGSDKQPVGRPILFNIEDGEYSFSNFTSTLRIKDVSQVSAEYLQQYLYFRWLNGDTRNLQSHTTGIHNLDFKAYLNFDIILPPLEEQKRIVKILDEKFAQLETIKTNAQTNLQNAKDLFQSQLTKAFVFPQGNTNTTWEKRRLGDVCEIITGPFGSSIHKTDYVPNGIPMINPQNIVDGYIIPLEKCLVSENTAKNLERFKFVENDIVIARRGEMGRCAVIRKENENWLCGTGSFIIRSNSRKVNSDFLQTILSSKESKEKLEKESIGATMPNLNQGILGNFEIPLPPLPEQKRIVKELDILSEKVKALQNIYEQMLLDCEELKQSFLCKAFAGEL